MTRLIKRKARRMDSQKSQIKADGTREIGSHHLAALEDDNGCNSDSGGESNEIEISATPAAAAATSTESEEDDSENDQTREGNTTKHRHEYDLIYHAALKGDWQAAEVVLGLYPDFANVRITRAGDTALHVAVSNKRTKFVQELLKQMKPSDLLLQNEAKYTAFHYAAASGVVDIASALINKYTTLPTIFDRFNMIPLHLAVSLGVRDMVLYLQQHTQFQDLPQEMLFKLLMDTTRGGMYDVALNMLEKYGTFATVASDEGTILHQLAGQDISDISACREAILERFVSVCAAARCLSWLKRKFEQPLMRKKARLLVEKLWAEIRMLGKDEKLRLIANPLILHEAARAGNVEFITMLARADPDLVYEMDGEMNYTMFHIAVLERQESVFRLIRQVGAVMYIIASLRDDNGNNILHLVGNPVEDTGKIVSAALQMQRELLWFKEMGKILPPFCANVKNHEQLRPRELFSRGHVKLLKEAELWMRETADSCMLVATIILTVAFAAAFTVPGGNNSELGTPILLKRTWFKAFMAFDAVAMFCSTFSITMFLSILTSRFCEDDFLVKLPLKLLLGLAGLFGSLVGTISAFTSACFLILNVERSWLPILFGFLACGFLTSVYIFQYLGLIVETTRLTFGYGYLLRPSKHSLY